MALVFIDANIYLSAFKRRTTKYRELLSSLGEISSVLLVSRIVTLEFERNKAQVYRDNNNFQRPVNFTMVEVYPHYTEDTKEVEALNRQIRQLREKANQESKALYDRQQEVHRRNLEAIAIGSDDVSKSLKPIFDLAVTETPEQLERARRRREIGQPPGKLQDSLGDQISWEQLLDASIDKDEIWIVTEDTDYYIQIGDKSVLVPTLAQELSEVRGVTVYKHYSDLAKFFEEFRKSGLVPEDRLPLVEVIEAVTEEIRQDREREILLQELAHRWLETQWPPNCSRSPDGRHRVPSCALYPSQSYGERTFQGRCDFCGTWVDTGEFVD
jgi:hypothetical protein